MKMFALGRLKAGAMNKTEAAYAKKLELEKSAGLIAWYKFEALKLRLADSTFYTPDFIVMRACGLLEAHEVKGFMLEDANIKIKVAAEIYPFKFILVKVRPKKLGGGWTIKEISP